MLGSRAMSSWLRNGTPCPGTGDNRLAFGVHLVQDLVGRKSSTRMMELRKLAKARRQASKISCAMLSIYASEGLSGFPHDGLLSWVPRVIWFCDGASCRGVRMLETIRGFWVNRCVLMIRMGTWGNFLGACGRFFFCPVRFCEGAVPHGPEIRVAQAGYDYSGSPPLRRGRRPATRLRVYPNYEPDDVYPHYYPGRSGAELQRHLRGRKFRPSGT